MHQNAIKLAVTGMDHRSELLFKKTVEHRLKNICELVFVQDAEVCIIDMDSPNAKEYWESLKDNFPELPVLVLSFKPVNEKNAIYLRKPIKIPSLVSTLRLLFPKKFLHVEETDQLPSIKHDSSCTNKPHSRTADSLSKIANHSDNVVSLCSSGTSSESYLNAFDANNHLAQRVKKALTEAKALKKLVKLSLWNNRIILIKSDPDEIITNLSEGALRSLSIVTIGGKETKVVSEYVGPEILDSFDPKKDTSIKRYKAESFLWFIGILTARGRIPLELGDNIFLVDKPIYIQHWPNLTRLEPIPYAQQIVALLAQHPRTIGDITSILEIDAKHIANLLYAAFMIGCAGQAKRPSDKLFDFEQPRQHKHRKVLSAIMGKLRSITLNKAQSA